MKNDSHSLEMLLEVYGSTKLSGGRGGSIALSFEPHWCHLPQGDFHIAYLEGTTSTTIESILSLLTCSLGLILKAKLPRTLLTKSSRRNCSSRDRTGVWGEWQRMN